MNELYINGSLCDLSDFSIIGVTKQANDIGELQNRQGDFTNTFKLPLTQRNLLLTGIPNDVQSNSSIPYQILNITYIQNGVTIVTNGRGVIESVNEFIELSVTAGNISLSDAIGDITVGDLFDSTFTWNLTNVIDTTDYWIYPLIDWRTDIDTYFDTAETDARFMLPCLKMPEFFQRLETYTGFQFDGTFINSSDFNQMVITPTDFVRTATLEVNSGRYILSDTAFPDTQLFDIPADTTPPVNVSLLFNIKTNTFSNSEFSQGTTPRFIPATNQVGILRFSALLNTFRFCNGNNSDVELYATTYIVNHTDSIVLSYQQTSVFTTQMNIGIFPNFNISFETDEMTFVAGKEYRVYTTLEVTNINLDSTLRATWQNSKFEFQQTKSIIFGSEISFKDLFRMKAKDVFKDALNLRCLMLQTDNYSNITRLDYFNDIKDKTPIDWTSKLDISAKNISFTFGKYARRNWLRFKNNTNVQDQIGDAYFDVSNDNLEADKDVIKLSHPATEQRSKFEGVNIPKIKAIDSDLQWNKPDYRILNVALQPIEVDYTDGTTTTTVTECPVANFIGGDVILENYYDSIQAILDKSKVVNLPFRLNAIDIENIDYLTPIYVECFGTFYLNKINAFKGDVTFCELVRL
jgi:hypothetical protein